MKIVKQLSDEEFKPYNPDCASAFLILLDDDWDKAINFLNWIESNLKSYNGLIRYKIDKLRQNEEDRKYFTQIYFVNNSDAIYFKTLWHNND